MDKKLIPTNKWLKIDPNEVLRVKCKLVDLPLSCENQILIKKMQIFIDAAYDGTADEYKIKKGIAIAAPQLGVPVQIIYIHFKEPIIKNQELNSDDEDVEPEFIEQKYLLANPKIIGQSAQLSYLKTGEGCLSVDEKHEGYVYRKHKIIVQAFNLITNQEEEIPMQDYLSICFQHEFDHLNGILYYDRISKNNPFEKKGNAIQI